MQVHTLACSGSQEECNFQYICAEYSNIKAVLAHAPVAEKEADELLAKSALELSTGCAGVCCTVFLVPRHMDDVLPDSVLKDSIITCTYLSYDAYKHIHMATNLAG